MDFEGILIFVCGIGAAASFVLFILPYLDRQEQKQQVMDIIAERRKTLYEDTKAQLHKKKPEETSAAENIGVFFKVEQLAGHLALRWRKDLAQAGYRSPSAVLVFLALRIGLPVGFCILAMLILAGAENPVPEAVTFLILMGVAAFGYFLPRIMVKNQMIKRQEELNLNFPDALDLMLICVQGGISIEPTIDRVAKEVMEHAPVLAEELGLLGAELGLIANRKEAFGNFAARVGSGSVKTFANAMVQAEQYGTGVSKALRVLSDDLRDQRMAEAERKAASLPPKLTVPMILFFLPALFIVILGPAIIKATAAGAMN